MLREVHGALTGSRGLLRSGAGEPRAGTGLRKLCLMACGFVVECLGFVIYDFGLKVSRFGFGTQGLWFRV